MEYKNPALTVDICIFTYDKEKNKIEVVLKKRREDETESGKLSIFGSFVGYDERIEEAIKRTLESKAYINIDKSYLKYIETGFSDELNRDDRGRVISLIFTLFIPKSELSEDLIFLDINNLNELSFAYNHLDIIKKAYNNINVKENAYLYMLGPEFYSFNARDLCYLITKNESIKKSTTNFITTHGEFIENTNTKKKLTAYDKNLYIWKLKKD